MVIAWPSHLLLREELVASSKPAEHPDVNELLLPTVLKLMSAQKTESPSQFRTWAGSSSWSLPAPLHRGSTHCLTLPWATCQDLCLLSNPEQAGGPLWHLPFHRRPIAYDVEQNCSFHFHDESTCGRVFLSVLEKGICCPLLSAAPPPLVSACKIGLRQWDLSPGFPSTGVSCYCSTVCSSLPLQPTAIWVSTAEGACSQRLL